MVCKFSPDLTFPPQFYTMCIIKLNCKGVFPMRSDVIKKGIPAAPNRSLLYALGYTKEELERPLIGVVCSYN